VSTPSHNFLSKNRDKSLVHVLVIERDSVLLCDSPDNKTNECKEESVDERMCRHRRLVTLEKAVKVKYEEGKMAKEKNSSLGRRPTSKIVVEKKEALLVQGRNERYFPNPPRALPDFSS